jgi:CRISPR-associated RAMP protein, csm3 family
MAVEGQQAALKGKLKITATLRLETGLHIGASSDFSPIGEVDSPFIRDPFTKQPIVPGSSLKGKMRTLLAKSYADGYILNPIDEDVPVVARLFGTAQKDAARAARLQFSDCRMTEESVAQFEMLDLDTYIGEAKYENSISRLSAVANPRQIERVPAGAKFSFALVYNVEREDELEEDMKSLADGFRLLMMDYIGGHGSRGYGRISFGTFEIEAFSLRQETADALRQEAAAIAAILNGSR